MVFFITEQLAQLGVDKADTAIAIDHERTHGGGFNHLPEIGMQSCAHADVANGGDHRRTGFGLNGVETDFNGKLHAILAASEQLTPDSHRPFLRRAGIVATQAVMAILITLRQQHFNLLAEQFSAGITELMLKFRICHHDVPIAAHHHQTDRCRINELPEPPAIRGG